jgi:hypothetical protein
MDLAVKQTDFSGRRKRFKALLMKATLKDPHKLLVLAILQPALKQLCNLITVCEVASGDPGANQICAAGLKELKLWTSDESKASETARNLTWIVLKAMLLKIKENLFGLQPPSSTFASEFCILELQELVRRVLQTIPSFDLDGKTVVRFARKVRSVAQNVLKFEMPMPPTSPAAPPLLYEAASTVNGLSRVGAQLGLLGRRARPPPLRARPQPSSRLRS